MTDIDAGSRIDEHRLELLHRRLAERGLLSRSEPAAPRLTDELSDGQRRMWFVQAADPSGAVLNVCVSYRITGDIDGTRLHEAVNAVARKHRVLRTTYAADETGDPRASVHPDLLPRWVEHDLSQLSEHARRLRLEVLAQREFAAPFELASDAPLRITLVRIGPAEHVMLLVAHHIAWDDGSWRVFFEDLTRAYTGAGLGAEPRAYPTTDVAGDTEADLAYWRATLADPPEPLELPGPNGSGVPTSFRSHRATATLDAETAARVSALARETGSTPYMVLLTVFGALLQRYTHTDDLLVVTPVLNRGPADTIGYYGNTVAMRLRPRSAATFREFLLETRDTAADAFAHQRINLDRVVRELNPDRRHGAERLTRVSFGFRQPDGGGFRPPGVHCERAELRSQFTQLPLGLMVEFDTSGVVVECEHLLEILEPDLGRRLLDHYVGLVGNALAAPDRPLADLVLLSAEDDAWLRDVSHGEQFDTAAATLTDLVSAQVAATPDAVAVVYDGRRYSYRDINEAANRVAHWLIGRGIGTEDRVAVLLDKSPELVITALGIVKAGAVYLPIDPEYPQDRLAFILGDSDPKLVLREPLSGLDAMPTDNPTDDDRVRPLRPDNTAYLIYTSGSTGLPKGVPVAHQPVAEYFVWFGREYGVDENDRLLQVASPSFDVSIAEVFGILACGARLVIPRPDGLRDIGYLTDLLSGEGITSMHFVPSLLGLFLSLPGVNQWRTLRRVPIGGEALPGEVADRFHATFDALLHNFYGPTETVINASRYKVEGKQGTRVVPIGKPKINTAIHLLDDALRPVPVGVIGEIYIGGTHLARGYHRRPSLTAQRFVADPFTDGGRLYRSGDLARRNADGDIEFVGRADEQVKIRGFRIELGDVAAAISVDPSVGQAVVVVSELPELGKSLVGYLTPAADGGDVDVDRIRARVSAALPEYMVPAGYVVLDEIPITAHGKIDRAALPDPDIAAAAEFREPQTDTERLLADTFAELLGRERVGADDSFFELGGHSLLATKLVAAIRTRCGVDIGVREIFELGTVARLAQRVEANAGSHDSPRPAVVSVAHGGPAPLSASQLRSWFAYRVEGPSARNNIPFAVRLHGPCDVDALAAAINDVVARHEILRTTYREIDGVPHQIINAARDIEVRRGHGDGEVWLQRELDDDRGCVFDLEIDWPIRAAVLRAGPDEHVLSLVIHHIAGDHWSAGVLLTDLSTAYRARREGRRPSWAPLPVQYADYGAWQTQLLDPATGIVGPQRDYWARQLHGLPEETSLRLDHSRPRVPSGVGESVEFTVTAATRDKLAALGRQVGVTDFMLLQAAVAVVLHKAGAGADIAIGAPVAGRTDAQLEKLIGFFVNFVVLRNELHGNPSLREVLVRARETALGAYANQDLPFEHVVDVMNPPRSLSRNPLFQVVVHVRDSLPDAEGAGQAFTAIEPPFDVAHIDLSVNFFLTAHACRGHVVYRPELYERATVQRFVQWLGRVIETFADAADTPLDDVEIGDAFHSAGAQGVTVHLLDGAGRAVPVGVVGDVVLDGGQFADGRWRTGERGWWTDDGQLRFVNRTQRPATDVEVQKEPPRTDTERALAAMLADLLGIPEVSRGDDFFTLGGDSIMAVQLAARARDAGMALTARMVFEHPAVHDLAAALDAAENCSGPADVQHAPMTASGLSDDELAALTSTWESSP